MKVLGYLEYGYLCCFWEFYHFDNIPSNSVIINIVKLKMGYLWPKKEILFYWKNIWTLLRSQVLTFIRKSYIHKMFCPPSSIPGLYRWKKKTITNKFFTPPTIHPSLPLFWINRHNIISVWSELELHISGIQRYVCMLRFMINVSKKMNKSC